MGAQRSPGDEEHKPFIDQVFEDQGRELTAEEAAALGLSSPAEDSVDQVTTQTPAVDEVEQAVEPVPVPEPELEAEQELEAEPGLTAAERALVDEAMKKSGLIWVSTAQMPGGRAFWHGWLAPTAYLLTGTGEQPDPDWVDRSTVSVLVRSKDNVHRLVTWDAIVSRVDPSDADWDAATAALVAGRLNLRDSDSAPSRWAGGAAMIYRLQPMGTLRERPGRYSDVSHRAAPVGSTATTVGRKPWVLHKRGGSGRPLS